MSTIRTSIVVQDMASSVFARINSNLNKTTSGFKNLNNQMSVAPTKAITNAEKMNESALQTELAYQAELQTLKQVESEARRIIAAEGTQTAKAQDIIASVREQRNLVQNLKTDYDNVSKGIKQSSDNQEKFNNSINTANTHGNKLLSTIKNIAVAVGGIAAIKGMVDLSDTVTSNRARLELIVDDNGSVDELENKIFSMANRTRSDFLDVTSVVSKLGILAGDSFKNNDEILAFTELMNKNFAIGGASIQEQTSAMYQLTQAMASGKLQGDEFRSIMENAPLLAEAIAEYTGKSKGDLKELSSQGVITSDIIKNAMFSAADKINERYNRMPMTWGQIWTKMKNVAVKALNPVLAKINELANNQQVQEMFNMFINGASLAAQAILALIEGVSWLVSVLEPVAPIIFGIVGAYVAFNIISGIVSAVLGVMTTAHAIAGAAEMLHAGKTLQATAAQWGLNSALLACPITWIVILIMALIVALTYLWFTNDEVAYWMLFLWDSLYLGILTAGLGIQAVWYALQLAAMYLWLGIQTVVLGMMGVWFAFQTGVEGVCTGILYIFQGLYNGVVWIVNKIIDALNCIPGVSIDTVEYADFADKALNNMIENVVDRNQKLQDMASQMDETANKIEEMKSNFGSELYAGATAVQNKAIELNTTREDRTAHRNDWINNAGSAIQGALDSFDFGNALDNNGTLGNIAGNTKDIADNTKEISDEDLQYLVDLAERETVNRFTTVPLTINMTNNNNIEGDNDIDGIVDRLTTRLEEELEYISDGVHE